VFKTYEGLLIQAGYNNQSHTIDLTMIR
jgi:hypothetical protein